MVSKSDLVIEPIEGVHRVLGWHEIEGKYHILAGGQIVLHFIPMDITEEIAEKFFKGNKISQKMIDEMKGNELTDEELNEKLQQEGYIKK